MVRNMHISKEERNFVLEHLESFRQELASAMIFDFRNSSGRWCRRLKFSLYLQIGLLHACHTGRHFGQHYSGDSGIYAPDGSLLVPTKEIRLSDAHCKEEKLLIYDIQNDAAKIRSIFPVLQDRKEIKRS